MIFQNEKTPFWAIKTKSSESRKNGFFQSGQSMVLVQNWPFFNFFLGNIGQENVFYDILERKNAFLSYKNKKFKQSKKWHFSKGVSPWFSSKICHFYTFLFKALQGREICFNDILERKNAFLGFKNQEVQKVEKMAFFQKGQSMVLVQNQPFFHLFVFGNIGQGNVF